MIHFYITFANDFRQPVFNDMINKLSRDMELGLG